MKIHLDRNSRPYLYTRDLPGPARKLLGGSEEIVWLSDYLELVKRETARKNIRVGDPAGEASVPAPGFGLSGRCH